MHAFYMCEIIFMIWLWSCCCRSCCCCCYCNVIMLWFSISAYDGLVVNAFRLSGKWVCISSWMVVGYSNWHHHFHCCCETTSRFLDRNRLCTRAENGTLRLNDCATQSSVLTDVKGVWYSTTYCLFMQFCPTDTIVHYYMTCLQLPQS